MTSKKGEQVRQKSPAEFFSENQIIAGFDNPGKSLYTSIRELVENSLDAAESIQVLPDIELEITEMTEAQFNKKRGLAGRAGGRLDTGLFENPAGAKKGKGGKKKAAATDDADEEDNGAEDPAEAGAGKGGGKGSKADARTKVMYYTVACRDNGCGLPHKDIPDMLGRVLSGSKYGVRQTRGKFGLGAKMALIWAKKSTGMPIEIRCAHSADSSVAPTTISNCILDIDIHRNEPKVEVHERLPNPSGWRGAEISVTVGGNWTTYRGKVLSYFQQLAVITPYASFKLAFHAALDSVDSKGQSAATSNAAAAQRCVEVHYVRRSSTIPDLPTEVKFHPSSVDNMLVSQLLQKTRVNSLASFLTTELQGVDKSVAARIVAELGAWAQEDTPKGVAAASTKVMALTQALRDVTLFKPPDGKCLSPAGEYNLRLGIQKEVDPVFVATYTMPKPSANEGHPFVVECGVALGGAAAKDGITVHRFANRIPLLFEPGSDVATRVANRKIKWGSYKIDPKKDKIGIFVSIVSTKIPFKGTSKEYIGEDCEPIAEAVRKALMNCAAQLKHHIVRRESEKEQKNRLKNLTKYVPDVSDALFKVLQKVYDRDGSGPPAIPPSSSSSSSSSSSPKKRGRPEEEGGAGWSWFGAKRSMMAKMHDGSLTKDVLIDALTKHAEASDFLGGGGGNGGPEEAGPASGGKGNAGGKGKAGAASSSAKKAAAAASSRDAFLMVLPDEDDDEEEEEEEEEEDDIFDEDEEE
eukprot:CAMPEP_0171895878 /NCGR_PEP_ID=MMETSP0992-20121227/47277_1 /TAXON_ID=483369 /ORGANISM="non described non described, Strain CCMP2098" /LENGTH=749 /DNA_ID=CAMNT_0012523849 /DNA_START=66 /DNA_END=2312 /DNA_ORIENTATION=+